MPAPLADADKSVLLLVDVQPTFLGAILDADRVARRAEFLARSAAALGIPVFATEQNPERMGGTLDALLPFAAEPPAGKMAFSCSGCEMFGHEFGSGRPPRHVILAGIETHICVTQTALELLAAGHVPFVAADAVGSRSQDRHELGLRRVETAGAIVAHSESVVYEWMRGADHPKFREVLGLVKAFG